MGFMHMEWEHRILETLTFDSMKSEKNKKMVSSKAPLFFQ